jgi:hypothetical protein
VVDEPEVLNKVIFAAEDVWLLVILTAGVVMGFEMLRCRVELVTISAVASSRIWREYGSAEGSAPPAL